MVLPDGQAGPTGNATSDDGAGHDEKSELIDMNFHNSRL